MKFTQIPSTTFQQLQLNAGILLSSFTPSASEISASNILGATTGGVSFAAKPTFTDFGDNIDNCPKNTMELKRLDDWDVTMSGTFVTVSTQRAKSLIGLADIDTTDTTKVIPRKELLTTDFSDLWWVGDYSDKNGSKNGGFIAIHLINAISTGGFALKTGNKEKGQFAFEYKAHFSIDDIDTVPFEVYIKSGTEEVNAEGNND